MFQGFALQTMVLEMGFMPLLETVKGILMSVKLKIILNLFSGTFRVVEEGRLFSPVRKLYILIIFYSRAPSRRMQDVSELNDKAQDFIVDLTSNSKPSEVK